MKRIIWPVAALIICLMLLVSTCFKGFYLRCERHVGETGLRGVAFHTWYGRVTFSIERADYVARSPKRLVCFGGYLNYDDPHLNMTFALDQEMDLARRGGYYHRNSRLSVPYWAF